MNVSENIISALVPAPEACRIRAAELRAAYPSYSKRQLAERAVSTAKKWAAAAGAGSGVGGNPLAAGALALGEMGYVLRAEGQLIGTIAALYDVESTHDRDSFQADVLSLLFPAAVSEVLAQVGVQASRATTRTLIRKYISKDVLKMVIRFAAKYLGVKVTQKAIITKTVPLVGGAIGGTWNWLEVRRVGKKAIAYFES